MGNVLGFAHTAYRHHRKELCIGDTKGLGLGRIILYITGTNPIASGTGANEWIKPLKKCIV